MPNQRRKWALSPSIPPLESSIEAPEAGMERETFRRVHLWSEKPSLGRARQPSPPALPTILAPRFAQTETAMEPSNCPPGLPPTARRNNAVRKPGFPKRAPKRYRGHALQLNEASHLKGHESTLFPEPTN